MKSMVYQAVIDSLTLVLKRAGFCDFENDGTFDSLRETILNIPPLENPIIPGDPQREGQIDLEVMVWDGSQFLTVSRGLTAIKADAIEILKVETDTHLDMHYSAPVMRGLVLLLGDIAARRDGAPGRATTRSGINWVNESLDHYYNKVDEVEAEVTVAGVLAVSLDFDSLALEDPLTTRTGTTDVLDLDNRVTD